MRSMPLALVAFAFLTTLCTSNAYSNESLLQPDLFSIEGRPKDCPPCFNCNLEAFQCTQYSSCNKYNGKCSCPSGFGAEDCSQPVCGSLARGKEREIRKGGTCDCEDGWQGINCNVCQTNEACNALMPENSGGVCYQGGTVVKENYQMCDVTNRKILDQLKERKPQITFTCNSEGGTCDFQCMVEMNPP